MHNKISNAFGTINNIGHFKKEITFCQYLEKDYFCLKLALKFIHECNKNNRHDTMCEEFTWHSKILTNGLFSDINEMTKAQDNLQNLKSLATNTAHNMYCIRSVTHNWFYSYVISFIC